MSDKITVIGDRSRGGVYVLRIRVPINLEIAFGRFKKAKIIFVPKGDYLYIGSALRQTGSTSLARRLVRHATRTPTKKPHKIRSEMINFFKEISLGDGELLPKNPKKLFWNIDHLLDRENVKITNVIIIITTVKLEGELGKFLEDQPETVIIEKGLGANDFRGNTHVLHVPKNCDRFWIELPTKFKQKWEID